MTSILNCDSSLHGTQPGPDAQRWKLVDATRPASSLAVKRTEYVPGCAGVKVHGTGVFALVSVQATDVSDTHSPTTCVTPSRSRRTRCHSRRMTVARTL